MFDDFSQNSGAYVGGFTFGGAGGQQGSSGVPVPPQPQPAQPQPAQPQPAQPQPAQPQPAQPQPPMADFADEFNAPSEPAGDPNYKFGAALQAGWTTSVKLPAHSLQFDELKFLNLLAGSISLSRDEKLRIIESIPKLRQEQVDELIRIFEEERSKFLELSLKHSAQLKKLEAEHAADWTDIELHFKSQQTAQQDQNQADDIRKQLGL